jgi:predicted metal-binding protein
VVVDDRVNLKCRVPLCSGYGHNLMCPPNVMAADATRDVLRKYDDALVVQLDIPLTQDCVDEQFDGKTYAEAKSDAAQLDGLRESQYRFAHLMTDLERAAFKMGYRYAAAFSGGECVLCDECVGQASGEQCRHPFEARPSMEAVGIDVVATAEAAGLSVELPAEDHPAWTGLLLID